MPKIYKISRLGQKLIYKIRHHRGHGVHSPFVFNLINDVIEEKKAFYAYDEIQEFLDFKAYNAYLSKTHKLYFRLINHFKSQSILLVGLDDLINPLLLTAPSTDISCTCIDKLERIRAAELLHSGWEKGNISYEHFDTIKRLGTCQDCILLDINTLANYPDLMSHLMTLVRNNSFFIITNIRTNKANHALWNNIIENERRTVVLDLYKLGIIFFDKSLYRWKYQISF